MPEPVGPVTSRMPSGRPSNWSKMLLVVAEETEFRQAEQQRGLVQNTHDDAFPVIGGHGGNPEVQLLVAHLELDAAILRQALFRDGHRAGHDLETRDHGGQEFLRMGVHLVQLAVDAVADPHGRLQRFDVNVRGADADGFRERLQHQTDDRGIVAVVTGLAVTRGDHETALTRGPDRRATIELPQVLLNVVAGGANEIQLTADDCGRASSVSKSSGSAIATVSVRPSSWTGITR